MRAAAILTAAGSGSRFGSDCPKALVRLAGLPLLRHAHDRLVAAGLDDIVVTAPADAPAEVLAAFAAAAPTARVVRGGASRQESVARGLDVLDAEIVLVHDAARPLAPPAVIAALIARVRAGAAAVIPVVPVVDTIKQVAGDAVVRTVARQHLRAVQTPQAFLGSVLRAAHAAGAHRAGDEALAASDDAGLVEDYTEHAVVTVPGADAAMKITTRRDLLVAQALLDSGEWE